MIKKYKQFIKENVEIAEPKVKPMVKPTTRPSPIPSKRPSVIPRPKASLDQVVDKFIDLSKDNDEINALLKKKYNK
jgi:hypothetical protein